MRSRGIFTLYTFGAPSISKYLISGSPKPAGMIFGGDLVGRGQREGKPVYNVFSVAKMGLLLLLEGFRVQPQYAGWCSEEDEQLYVLGM